MAVRAKAHEPLPCGCAGETALARRLDDDLAQRPAVVAVGFADEDAQQHAFARQCHARNPAASACIRTTAAQNATNPSATCPTTLPSAAASSPPRINPAVSNVNEENVV